MNSHSISEYVDRQAEALAREEAALARLVGEGLERIGRIYARARLAEMLLGGAAGRVPDGALDPDEDGPAALTEADPPHPQVMFGVEVPLGRETEARLAVAEARARAASREPGARALHDARPAGDAWLAELYRAAYDEAVHSEAFIADILAGLIAQDEADAARSAGPDERVMRVLAASGRPLTSREIVAALGMNPRSLGPVMGKLCRAGKARRDEDGRYVAA